MSAYASDTYYYVSHDGSDPVPRSRAARPGRHVRRPEDVAARRPGLGRARSLRALEDQVALLVDGNVCVGMLGRDDIPHDAGPDEDDAGTRTNRSRSSATHRSPRRIVRSRQPLTDAWSSSTGTGRFRACSATTPPERLLYAAAANGRTRGRKRTLWEVIRTPATSVVEPRRAQRHLFQARRPARSPSQDGATSWLVVALERGTGDEGTLVLDPSTAELDSPLPGCPAEPAEIHPSNLIRFVPAKGGLE